MPNQFEPGMPVSITIDGKEYPIRFTLRVLKELQRDHGVSVISGTPDIFSDIGKLAIILYYGLRTANPDLTLDFVEENVDTSMLIEMIPALTFAMSGQPPKPRDVSPNVERPKVNGIGSPFGPSDVTTSD